MVAAIGLASWQLADTLKSREDRPGRHATSGAVASQSAPAKPATHPIKIVGAQDFDPYSDDGSENPEKVPKAIDGNTSTYWETSWYSTADLGSLKPGVGLIVDLGSAHKVGKVSVDLIGGSTSVDLMAAGKDAASAPTSLDGFTKVASGSGAQQLTLVPQSDVTSRYLLVWLTKLPQMQDGHYRGRIAEINVTS